MDLKIIWELEQRIKLLLIVEQVLIKITNTNISFISIAIILSN